MEDHKMEERRRSTREPTYLHGVIYFNNGRDSMSCVIRDFSYEGARIVGEATTSNSNWRLLVWTLRRGHVDNSLVCRVAWLHKRDVFLGVLRAQRFKHTTSHEASLRFWGQAEVDRQPKPAGSVENDPQRTSGERDRFDGNKNVAAGIDHALGRLEMAAQERSIAVGISSALPVSIDHIAKWAKAAEAAACS